MNTTDLYISLVDFPDLPCKCGQQIASMTVCRCVDLTNCADSVYYTVYEYNIIMLFLYVIFV